MAMVMENQQPLAPMPVPSLPPPPPPPPPPPLQAYKHRCKVCKKGFVCGRALGGHMRAHGVTDDGWFSADDDAFDDGDGDDSGPYGGAWDSSEAEPAAAAATTTKRTYSLRTNAGRHKNNCRVCENCGKEFTPWKSLLDHGRCNHHQEKDDLNIAGADVNGEDEEDLALAAGGWSKGKRTRRTKVVVVDSGSQIDEPLPAPTSREEEDVANLLVTLASSRGGAQAQAAIVDIHQQPYASAGSKQERAPAASNDDQQRFLVPPQPISAMLPPTVPQLKFLAPPQVMLSPVVPRGFECKACKKVFTSHQALGGHRASHKKVKGCFAAKLEDSNSRNDSPQPSAAASSSDHAKVVAEAIPAIVESNGVAGNAEGRCMINARTTAVATAAATSAPEMAIMQVADEAPSSSAVSPFKKKGKVHECSICHRVFMSGQALGGHKRCHWFTSGAGGDPMDTVVAKLQAIVPQDHVMQAMCQQLTLGPPTMYGTPDSSCLDLNVPTMNQSADPAATPGINESMLSLNAPASLYMHSWAGHTNGNTAATSGHYDLLEATASEDEADSTSAKRAKISDLKDMNMAGETSPWLQVGIALPSETNERLLEPKG